MGGTSLFGLPLTSKKSRASQLPSARRARSEIADTLLSLGLMTTRGVPGPETPKTVDAESVNTDSGPQARKTGLGSRSTSDTVMADPDRGVEDMISTVHRKASSQLLRSRRGDGVGVSELRSRNDSLPERGSSSTLHSFYDPKKTPLAISQQTSNSSARDFALRRGLPKVVSTSHRANEGGRASESRSLRRPARSEGVKEAELNQHKPRLAVQKLMAPKSSQRPTALGPLTSDHIIAPTIPLGPMSSQKHTLNIAQPRNSQMRVRKDPRTGAVNSPVDKRASTHRPLPSTRNWFDNLGLEESDDEVHCLEPELLFGNPKLRETGDLSSVDNAQPRGHDRNFNTFRPTDFTIPPVDRSPYAQLAPLANPTTRTPAQEQLRQALENWEQRNEQWFDGQAKTGTIRSRSTRTNAFEVANLQQDSVLDLSSSEDEEYDESNIGNTVPGIRESIVLELVDTSDVEIGTARAAKSKRPRLASGTSSHQDQRPRSSPLHHFTNNGKLAVPERSSSRGFPSLSSEPSRSLPTTRESSSLSLPIERPLSSDVRDSVDKVCAGLQRRISTKVMTVSRQEEELLRAMRSRRASMRQLIFAEALQDDRSHDRHQEAKSPHPLTGSGLDVNDASFLHLSAGSVPTLPSIRKHRHTISGDDFPIPDVVASRLSGSTDAPPSRRASFAHSSFPSSSTSHELPATPTMTSIRDSFPRGIASTLKRYSGLSTGSPSQYGRVRPTSTNYKIFNDEDGPIPVGDFPAWAYNGWSENQGLAIVH